MDSGNRGKSSWNYCTGYVDYCYNLCKNKKYKTGNTIINWKILEKFAK